MIDLNPKRILIFGLIVDFLVNFFFIVKGYEYVLQGVWGIFLDENMVENRIF